MTSYESMVDMCHKKCTERMTVRQASKSALAGFLIAIGAMMLLLVKSDGSLGASTSAVTAGACFSVGLFAVFTCGGELFTGDCLMIVGLREGRCRFDDMAVTLACVWVFNYIGAVAAYAVFRACGMDVQLADGIAAIAESKGSMPMTQLFARSVVCNVLVCMSVWIASQTDRVDGKMVAAMMPVATFVALGFEHSVANMFLYMVAGLDPVAMIERILVCTAGNVVGGMGLFGGVQILARGKA